MFFSRSRFRLFLLVASATATASAQQLSDDPTPLSTPWPPPDPFTDAQFLYKHFQPAAADPQQGDWYFRLFVPPGYDPNGSEKHPVVIFLHGIGEVQGAGGNQKQMANNGQFAFCQAAKQSVLPCFFLLPATNNVDFSERRQTIQDLLAVLAQGYRIDRDRVIITGLSYGGGHTIRLASSIPQVFCAAVPLSANADATVTDGMLQVPMWYFTAKNDGITPPFTALSNARSRLARGGRTIVTLYDSGGHSSSVWSAAWGGPTLIPWLALQRRGVPMRSAPAEITITSPTRNPAHQRPGSTLTFSGTVVDPVLGGTSAALTKVEYSNGNYPFAGVGFSGSTTILGTTPATIAAWTTGSLALGFSSGPVLLTAAAVGTSWSTGLGGETYYLTGLSSTFISSALLAPENVRAGLLEPGSVALTWEYPATGTTHTGFKIERKAGSTGTFAEIATPAASERALTDVALLGDLRYYYRIRATGVPTDSLFTGEIQVLVLNDSDSDGMPDFWETQFMLNPNDAADAMLDADGDGRRNFLEYALDSPPRFPSLAREPVLELDAAAGVLALSYLRAREELSYEVESTTDFALWSITAVSQGTAFPGQTARATVPLGDGSPLFLRLRVPAP